MNPSLNYPVLGVEYCTGYVDEEQQWRKGFYCPKKADGVSTFENSKDIFCCGTQTKKYCCERKEGLNTSADTGLYVSFSTLVSVSTAAFILAAILTALAFICCRRYWKGRNVEIHETHFYRMACSSSNAPLVSPATAARVAPFTTSAYVGQLADTAPFNSPPPLTASPSTLLDMYSLSMPHHHQHRRSATHHELALSVIGPPPPYQSHPSLECSSDVSSNTTATNLTSTNSTHSSNNQHNRTSNDVTVSIVNQRNKQARPIWRKLSQ